MGLRARKAKPHPEDAAIRIALRAIARRALALEDLLGEGVLWGDSSHELYRTVVEDARRVGEMQWEPRRVDI